MYFGDPMYPLPRRCPQWDFGPSHERKRAGTFLFRIIYSSQYVLRFISPLASVSPGGINYAPTISAHLACSSSP